MGRKGKRGGRPIHGWLVVDKPTGMTSTDVVNAVRRSTGAAKVGHSGTLDPIATGVLPIALGEATKTVAYAMEGLKDYSVTIRWGETRTTDDAEGELVASTESRPTAGAIEAALPAFTGDIEQVPPRFSAVKIQGERAYDLAREGADPELPSRIVHIESFRLSRVIDNDHAAFEVRSGKGAFVRALARDLAANLGTYGHMAALRRRRVGPFDESQAVSLDTLRGMASVAELSAYLLPVATALDDIPAVRLSGKEAQQLRHGQAVPMVTKADRGRLRGVALGDIVLARQDETPLGIVRFQQGQLQPVRMLNLTNDPPT